MLPNQDDISFYKETIKRQAEQIQILEGKLDWFMKQQFGAGKGEQLDPNQLELDGLKKKEESCEKRNQDADLIEINFHRKKTANKRRSRGECFENLPIGDTEILIPAEVEASPKDYAEISRVESSEVIVTPPSFYKKVTTRIKYKRIDNKNLPPIIAPAPKKLIDGSYLSVELITYIIISKFLDHLPLYRQEQIFKRYGLNLSRKLMNDWVGKIAIDWLKPIYSYMLKDLRKCNYLQLDETTTQYINGKIKKGKSQKGYFWVISQPYGDVVFLWSTSRKNENVVELLGENYEGTIQTDGYATYHSYAKKRSKVTHVGCGAHVRRKFFDAKEEYPLVCCLLIRLFNVVFAYEAKYKEEELSPKEIVSRRKSESAMTLSLIKRIIDHYKNKPGILPDSKFGKALTYATNQWNNFIKYLDNGEVQISNNLVENAVRPIALGRKNWLFVGHQDAGENTAIIYSILGSCKRHGIDPAAYLRDTLNHMLNAKVQGDDFYAQLTPAAYKAQRSKVAA